MISISVDFSVSNLSALQWHSCHSDFSGPRSVQIITQQNYTVRTVVQAEIKQPVKAAVHCAIRPTACKHKQFQPLSTTVGISRSFWKLVWPTARLSRSSISLS